MPGVLDQIQANLRRFNSQYQNPYLKRNPALPKQGGSSVDYQLIPYVQQAAQEAQQKKEQLTPLQTIFDLLSRGQYTMANLFSAVGAGKPYTEALKAAGRGLTGQEKGDFKQVLFGGQTPYGQQPGIIPWQPQTQFGNVARNVASFVANVVMDPTTYIGLSGGVAKPAKVAAKTYADNATRLFKNRIANNPEMVQGLLQGKGFNAAAMRDILTRQGVDAAGQYLQKHGGTDLAREMNTFYKQAFREGTRLTPDQLVAKLTPQVNDIQQSLAKNLTKQFPGEAALANVAGTDMNKAVTAFQDVLNPELYKGAGTRAMRLMGVEFGVKESYPGYIKALDTVVGKLRESPLGGAFANAAWSVAGPGSKIGKLKELFGFRNPYQQMIRSMERDIQEIVPVQTSRYVEEIRKITTNFDEPTLQKIKSAMVAAQNQPADVWQGILKQSVGEKDLPKATDAVMALNELTSGWRAKLQQGIDEGLISDMGVIDNYMPVRFKQGGFYKNVGPARGTPAPGFARERVVGEAGHQAADVRLMEILQGVDHPTAVQMVQAGYGSTIETDMTRALVGRAIAQSKVEMRMELLRQFRDMGLNVKSVLGANPDIALAMRGAGSAWQQLGVVGIPDPALAGYMFDKDVADVLQKAVAVTSSDAGLTNVGHMMDSFTSWVKGWLTLSPGFNVRNAQSNTWMGFMKFGPRWFNPKMWFASTVATFTGLYGKDRMIAALGKAGIPPHKIEQWLGAEYGGKTLQELADIATQKGVISRATMGYDIPSTIEQMMGKGYSLNPMSSKNVLFKGSHAAGNVIESQPRFQMFLTDYMDLAGKTSPEAAIDYAKNEAKKWFLDYGDLTPFEQKVMKKIVPFYTWIRKNLFNQIDMMIHTPDMYSTIPKAQRMLENQDVSQNQLPEWMKQSNYIPLAPEWVPQALKGGVTTIWPNLPYGDVNTIPVGFEMSQNGIPHPVLNSPLDTLSSVMSSAHPLLKSLAEIIPTPGYDLFYRSSMGATKAVPGLTRFPKAVMFIDGLLRDVGISGGIGAQLDKNGHVVIDSKVATLLDENLPLLNQLDRWIGQPSDLAPIIDNIQQATYNQDKKKALDTLMSVLSFHAGIKLKDVNLSEQQKRDMEDIMRQAEQSRLAARKQLPGYATRSAQYWANRTQRVQRVVGPQYGNR